MTGSHFLPRIFVACLILSVSVPQADAQKRRKKKSSPATTAFETALAEHSLSAKQIDDLIDKKINVLMHNGKELFGYRLVDVVRSRDKSRVKSIKIQQPGKSRVKRFAASKLFHIEASRRAYQFCLIPSQKAYALIDAEQRDKTVQQQLKSQRRSLWKPIPEDKQKEHVEEYKAYLKKVQNHFNDPPMQLHETKYFLFLTDMPSEQVAPYLVRLDTMNEKLGEAFGFAPGQNVWRGKAVIIAFVQKARFYDFEKAFMNNNDATHAQGLCHPSDNGKVIVSCYRGDRPAFFAQLLVHETAHGYVHRYKSNVWFPSWLNEGIADWIGGTVVPASPVVIQRQNRAAAQLRRTHRLGSRFFENGTIQAWQYGVASAMVDLLIRHDSVAFRMFLDGIKTGLTCDGSLQRAYGMTRQDLVGIYGRAIRIPDLTL